MGMVEKMVSGTREDTPPPGVGFDTEIDSHPRLRRSAAVTVACNWELLVNVVTSGFPFSSTAAPGTKFDPVTVMAVSFEPLRIACGDTAAMVGARLKSAPEIVRFDVAMLLLGSGSFSEAFTCAFIIAVPALACCTVKVTVAEAPLTNEDRSHRTVVVPEQVPTDVVVDVRTPVEGIVAINATLDAEAG